MSTDLVVNPEEFGLEKENVLKIEEAFTPKIVEREALAKIYADVITKEINQNTVIEAAELRRKLVKVRTGIADIHKTQKAFFLASGRFVDAWKNKETEPVTQMEEKLMEIEKYYENQEKERLEKIQKARAEELSQYVSDAHERDLSGMADDVWDAYLSAKKQAHEDQLAAEKKAEEDRKAQEEEDRRKRKEAEAKLAAERKKARELQKTRDERAEELRPYITFIRDYEGLITASDTSYKKQLDEIKKGYDLHQAEQAKRRAEEELERKKREEQAERERKQRQKEAEEAKAKADALQAELDAKKEAEEKAKREEAERLENELSKGDEEKIKDLINDLETITTKYEFKAPKNVETYEGIKSRIYAMVKHLNETN